jgi:hypothetical protein
LIKRIIVIAYILGAILVWIDFRNSPPDGLANVGIGLYTLPVFLLVKLFTAQEFPYFSGDYYDAHTKYFVASVLIISVMLYFILLGIEKMRGTHNLSRV